MQTKGYLGIDVSKGYADFVLLSQEKAIIESGFQLPDDYAGRKRLRELIDKWFREGLEELYCGVESTGGYENNWYSVLKGLGETNKILTARLNAKGVKSVSDASLKRTITDAVSAENIATYLICFPHKVDYGKNKAESFSNKFTDARKQYTYVRMLLKQKVQLSNQLEKLLYQYFAEMLVYCRNGAPVWLLSMLCKYPCADAVVKAGVTKLSSIKSITAAKAEVLIQKAQKSTQKPSRQLQHLIAAIAREILHKLSLAEEEKKYLSDLYGEEEQVKLLCSIKGVGIDSAIAILMEIEDPIKFSCAKKLSAYFGLHPVYKQSGDGIWGNHMSKKGRAEIRAVLFMASLTGIRFNPILKKLYAKYRAKRMKHYAAMGVVMHKLLRIIYGVLKNNTPFDPNIDEYNTDNAVEKQSEKKKQIEEIKRQIKQKKQRFQPVTENAPISRRAAQKIKKQITPQPS